MFKQKFWLSVFVIWQLFSVALISIGVWPQQVAFFNLFLQILAVLLFSIDFAVYSTILSIPFYLALPVSGLDTFSAWRLSFLALFLVFLYKEKNYFRNGQQQPVLKFGWDKYLKWFAVIAFVSSLISPTPALGIKKLLFVVNIFLLYVVIRNVFDGRDKILKLMKVSLGSLSIFIFFGFLQLAISLFSGTYYLWQYWAEIVAKNFYGREFALTSIYSNSWVSSSGGELSLRMFSLLPDSHAFAVISMFAVFFASVLLFFIKSSKIKLGLWALITLAVLGIIFSGTRGVWAGILAPAAVLTYLYVRHYGRTLLRHAAYPVLIFFAALIISPLINKMVSNILPQNQANFLNRAESIYDVNEASNAGRLNIWKYTLSKSVHNPLLGYGFGNFSESLNQSDEKAFNLPKKYISAHSLYLDLLFETGLIGLLIVLFFFWKVLQKAWNFYKQKYLFNEDGYVFYVLNAGLYFLWLLAYSVFDGTLINDRVLMYFFVILALLANIFDLYRKENA